MPRAVNLPNDVESLKRLVIEAQTALQAAEARLLSRQLEIEALKLQIAQLRRMKFGRSSEKLDRQIEQLELRLEALQLNDAEAIVAMPEAIASVESVSRSARRPLPAHLPREVRTHLPKQEACPDCGGELRKLGEDVSEVLERIPSHFKVIRHVRVKLACACCERIVQAAAPSRFAGAWAGSVQPSLSPRCSRRARAKCARPGGASCPRARA